jgi:tRNA acetyltransferase TAN1
MGKYGKKAKNNRINNPPRGGPGILVLCETGRESKCQREALDILQYYLYHSNGSSDPVTATTITATKDPIKDTTSSYHVESNNLSLDDEIAMLRKGISADAILNYSSCRGGRKESSTSAAAGGGVDEKKAPFRVYDTGCRGSVFIMCTMANCELVKTTISTAKHLHDEDKNPDEKCNLKAANELHQVRCDDDDDDDDNKEDPTIVTNLNGSDDVAKKRKYNHTGTCDDDDDDDVHKKHKVEKKKGQNDQGKWDPMETVQAIFRDVREKNKLVPRSRFVTRIIPIQVTCFASLDEIKANVRELIRTYLLPIGIQQHVKQKESNCSTDDTIPTFKIEFRRRNCSHIRREEVVEATAGMIQMLTDEYWSKHDMEGIQHDSRESLFRVDLTDPQYTILIEICRTLCGMSIVENAKSYRNFNLLVVQDQVGES